MYPFTICFVFRLFIQPLYYENNVNLCYLFVFFIPGHSIKIDSSSPSPTQPEYIIAHNTEDNISLHPCPICSRTFVPTTLVKHVRICEKTTAKKRQIFDSSRQRREGTDLALLPPPPLKTEHHRLSPPKSSILPRKSIDLAHSSPLERKDKSPSPATSNKSTTLTEKRSSLPSVVKRSLGPVTDQCPYCERFFGVKAYDR